MCKVGKGLVVHCVNKNMVLSAKEKYSRGRTQSHLIILLSKIHNTNHKKCTPQVMKMDFLQQRDHITIMS